MRVWHKKRGQVLGGMIFETVDQEVPDEVMKKVMDAAAHLAINHDKPVWMINVGVSIQFDHVDPSTMPEHDHGTLGPGARV